MGAWGPASFENEPANQWFYLVEEAVDPGSVIAETLDEALAEADHLEFELCCAAIAAAELSASCAGHTPERLPDHIRIWAQQHPHDPHDSEIAQAVQAVSRIRDDSELSEVWAQTSDEPDSAWLREVDELLGRLRQSGAGDPAMLSP